MVSFQTKNANLGTFWRTLEWKMLKHILGIWNILGIFYVFAFCNFVVIWYIIPCCGILHQKSGNLGR
jgi:hypothetical protein